MRTAEFIDEYCRHCGDFDPSYGCECYLGEECDFAYAEPKYRGKSMVDRVAEHCNKSKPSTKAISSKSPRLRKIQKESASDIILQIWNDGAEGIIYDESDLKEFKKRLRSAMRAR